MLLFDASQVFETVPDALEILTQYLLKLLELDSHSPQTSQKVDFCFSSPSYLIHICECSNI